MALSLNAKCLILKQDFKVIKNIAVSPVNTCPLCFSGGVRGENVCNARSALNIQHDAAKIDSEPVFVWSVFVLETDLSCFAIVIDRFYKQIPF